MNDQHYQVRLILLAALTCWAGCGPQHPPTYPVRGKVVFDDGAPLDTEGVILFESTSADGQAFTARGKIQSDGTFEMSTFTDGDGAVAGLHRVLVRAKRDAEDFTKRGIIPRPIIDEKFERYESSGLEFSVEAGDNQYTVEVRRAAKIPSR